MKPLSRAELKAALVPRRPEDHKGTYGHVLVVAGSRGMAGAAIMTARAALRSGVGLVTLGLPAGLQDAATGHAPEALTLGLPENSSGCLRPEAVSKLRLALKELRFDAMAVGPGLSRHGDAGRFLMHLLSGLALPAVIDADALNLLALNDAAPVRQLLRGRAAPCIYTPHPGELARCLRMTTAQVQRRRAESARELSRSWGGVTVLKGHKTIVAAGERLTANPTGGPGLAKGGTGDVLTGLIGGLWAQAIASGRGAEKSAFGCAALGVFLHGAAGDRAEREKTPWATAAQDVLEALPGAFRQLAG